MHEVRKRSLAALTATLFFAPAAALARQSEQRLPEVKVRAAPEPADGDVAPRSPTRTQTDTPLIETVNDAHRGASRHFQLTRRLRRATLCALSPGWRNR